MRGPASARPRRVRMQAPLDCVQGSLLLECCLALYFRGLAGIGGTAPGTTYKDISFRACAVPQLRCPAGLGCTAFGTSYKGISFRASAAAQLHGPAGLGCMAPGTTYKSISFGVLRSLAGLGCTAPRTAYEGNYLLSGLRVPIASQLRRFKVHGPRTCSVHGPLGPRTKEFLLRCACPPRCAASQI